MSEDHPVREVVSMFFKDSGKRVHLNRLIVLKESNSSFNGVPFVARDEYDVVYSNKFGYIFQLSGSGGEHSIEVSGIYHTTAISVARRLLGKPSCLSLPKIIEKPSQWVDARDEAPFDDKPRTQKLRERNRTRRLFSLPKAFNMKLGWDVLDWLEENGIQADSVWCSICRDHFQGNDWDLCNHCWWCDNTGNYSTPNDRCKCKDLDECWEGR